MPGEAGLLPPAALEYVSDVIVEKYGVHSLQCSECLARQYQEPLKYRVWVSSCQEHQVDSPDCLCV